MTLGRRLFAIAFLSAVGALAGCSREPSPRQVREWDAEIQRLQAEQDSLRQRAAELVSQDPRIQALPHGDAVIRIPTSFLRSVIQHVFDDVARNVTLSLGGIKAHVAKSVKKVVTIGQFVVDVDIHQITGRLRTRQPVLGFAGNQISMSLPVEVSEGEGRATIHFVWDGKNVAGVTCGDMDVTTQVTGKVIPSRYVVSGRLKIAMQGSQVIATPDFPETKMRIRVTPSKQSWATVDSILAEKRGVCGWVLDKVDVPTLLKQLVQEKGFNVGLPVHKIRPFAIPAAIRDSVTVGGRTVSVATTTSTIRIDPDAVVYGAFVGLK